MTYSVDFQKPNKKTLFGNVHHSKVPGPVWPKMVADRTPITTVGCVFRRGLKSGPREPKERKSAPARFLKALNKLGIKMEKTKVPKPLCFTRPNGRREKKEPKRGPLFFKKRCASAALGAFWESAKLDQMRLWGAESNLFAPSSPRTPHHLHGCRRNSLR